MAGVGANFGVSVEGSATQKLPQNGCNVLVGDNPTGTRNLTYNRLEVCVDGDNQSRFNE